MSEWHCSWQEKFPAECREVVLEKDGVKHYTTEIIAGDMQLLGRRSDNASNAPAVAPAAPAQNNAAPFAADGGSDDLPF